MIRNINTFCLIWILVLPACVGIGTANTEIVEKRNRWALTLYGGVGTNDILQDIVRFRTTEFVNYALLAAGVTHNFWQISDYFDLEWEVQLAQHFERPAATEVNPLVILRWSLLPWHKYLNGSFAFGNGVSYSSSVPGIEDTGAQRLSRALYYILFEFEFAASENWSAVVRVHHRSAAFGLLNSVDQGSNFLCLGIKRRF